MTLKWMKRPQPELVARASIWQVRMREVAGGVVFSQGRYRLVALTPSWDLFVCANDLFV